MRLGGTPKLEGVDPRINVENVGGVDGKQALPSHVGIGNPN